MSQSYGQLSFTPIAVPVDSILDIVSKEQLLGTSISGITTEALPSALTIELAIDGSSVQTITVSGNQPYDVASAIQTSVQTLAINSGFTKFTCRYDNHLGQYILESGTAGSSSSSVIVSGGTAAATLQLGTSNGGTESYTGHEVIVYIVKYQFVFNAGAQYALADVIVNSSDMGTPTNLSELMALANERAAQMKLEMQSSAYPYIFGDITSQDGPAPF